MTDLEFSAAMRGVLEQSLLARLTANGVPFTPWDEYFNLVTRRDVASCLVRDILVSASFVTESVGHAGRSAGEDERVGNTILELINKAAMLLVWLENEKAARGAAIAEGRFPAMEGSPF